MPVRIRLSRGGVKKRPFYRIVVADSRRARDGKFIDQIGTYNPMLPKDSTDRVKMDLEKAKEWISKGAKPSDRISIFLSNFGVMDKPTITEKTKKHLPKKKTQERLAAAKEKKEAAKAVDTEQKVEAADTKPSEEPKTEEPKVEAADTKPSEEPKTEEPKVEAAETKTTEEKKPNDK